MSLVPNVLWAQRKDKLYITIDLADVKGEKITLDPSGKLSFEGESSGKQYKLDLELLHQVDVEKSKWVVQPRSVQFLIEKKEQGPFWERLLKQQGKVWYLKADWNRWKDEDEGDEEFDVSNFDVGGGGFGGPGAGFGGGFPGADEMDFGDEGGDSEDEGLPDLESKPAEEKDAEEKDAEKKRLTSETPLALLPTGSTSVYRCVVRNTGFFYIKKTLYDILVHFFPLYIFKQFAQIDQRTHWYLVYFLL